MTGKIGIQIFFLWFFVEFFIHSSLFKGMSYHKKIVDFPVRVSKYRSIHIQVFLYLMK